jgi:DNA-binding MarR family transcriptional regulator
MSAALSTSTIRRELFRITRLAAGRRAFTRLRTASGIDLSQQEVQVLLALTYGGSQSIGGISRTAHMEKAAVSRNVSRLREAGLVSTATDRHKGSVVNVTVSEEGEQLATRIARAQDDHMDAILGAWSAQERDDFAGMLQRLGDDWEKRLGSS